MQHRDSTTSKSRLTVNLSGEEYAALEALAERSRVSKAWLGRHAIAELLKQATNDPQAMPPPLAAIHQEKSL
jgi:predicted transcriptional regulator